MQRPHDGDPSEQAFDVGGLVLRQHDLAHDPLVGTLRGARSEDGRRLIVDYVAYDDYPPESFWPEDGTKGFLDEAPSPGTLPVDLDADGAYAVDPEGKGVVGWYRPPPVEALALLQGTMSVAQACTEAETRLRCYRAWNDGELCGLVVETFLVESDGDSIVPLDQNATWSHEDMSTVLAARSLPLPQARPLQEALAPVP